MSGLLLERAAQTPPPPLHNPRRDYLMVYIQDHICRATDQGLAHLELGGEPHSLPGDDLGAAIRELVSETQGHARNWVATTARREQDRRAARQAHTRRCGLCGGTGQHGGLGNAGQVPCGECATATHESALLAACNRELSHVPALDWLSACLTQYRARLEAAPITSETGDEWSALSYSEMLLADLKAAREATP